MYAIEYTEEALADVAYFRKSERQQILDAAERLLSHEPAIETNNRKRLRPNELAEWELRLGKYRVFYDVVEDDEDETVTLVKIEAVGYKRRNKLLIQGEEFEL